MTDSVEAAWSERHTKLLEHADKETARYQDFAERSRVAARALNVISLFASVLAPVAVVSSAGGLSAFHIPDNTIKAIAVSLTIILGLTEGARRIFRFEQRWAGAMVAWLEIEKNKEVYLDNQVAKPIGSDEWVANLAKLRQGIEAATNSETTEFFRTVLSGETGKSSKA
jgi:hypothetical protein